MYHTADLFVKRAPFLWQRETDCDGCKTENGRLFSGCYNCQIRKCAKGKAIENCAHCNEYACDKLLKFFVKDPEPRERLDEIKKSL